MYTRKSTSPRLSPPVQRDFPDEQNGQVDCVSQSAEEEGWRSISSLPLALHTTLWTYTALEWKPYGYHLTQPLKTHRLVPDSALREFEQWVVHHQWTEVLEVKDVHTKWHSFVTTTREAFHRYFKAKSVTMHLSDAPWMTPRTKRLIR
ncbi:hypothetical protein E2C01_028148 [Portunus trituberculatus]|uniref:Uncharacterized protein n=1 Tax=Portunus trituberculatus TaxID=210409 RepID=A0A5B7EN97_PORTR|nr:hypothetical protein [Portunus trituberculatus]